MAQLKLDIPQSVIDEAAGKELDSARRKIKNLEKKVFDYQKKEAEYKNALRAFDMMREFMADNYDLYRDYGF